MKHSYIFLTLALLTLGTSGVAVQAYLTPEDVFNVDVPAASTGATTTSTSSVQSVASESTSSSSSGSVEPAPTAVPVITKESSSSDSSVMMIETTTSTGSSAMMMPEKTTSADSSETMEEEVSSSSSSTMMIPEVSASESESSSQGHPMFYRSGEQIEIQKEAMQQSSAETNPFNEEPVQEPTPTQEDQTASADNQQEQSSSSEPQQEAQSGSIEQGQSQSSEQLQAAASSNTSMSRLMKRIQYILTIVAIAIGGVAYLIVKRRGPKVQTSSAAPVQPTQSAAPTPAGTSPQNVEESSERLQHALEAMGEDEQK